jgi:hypothetical protein
LIPFSGDPLFPGGEFFKQSAPLNFPVDPHDKIWKGMKQQVSSTI